MVTKGLNSILKPDPQCLYCVGTIKLVKENLREIVKVMCRERGIPVKLNKDSELEFLCIT